jgi:hypothetical protein
MRPLRLLALSLIVAFATTAVAEAAVYDIPRVLRKDISRIAKRTDVPIRLPARMDLDYDRNVFGGGSGARAEYELEVAATDECGANVCFLARFSGEEGGEPAFRRTVSLVNGITGYYKPLTCGGSCSPPMIQWVQRGFLYSIQAKLGVSGRTKQRRAMVRAANSAIRSTPR